MIRPARTYCILGLVLFLSSVANSQEIGPLEADRPDQTETASVVPHGRIQIESGFSFERANSAHSSFAHPSVLFKYGVRDFFEVRLVSELTSDRIDRNLTTGLHPVAVGFKVRLLEEEGIAPKTSLIAHLAIPHLASPDFRATRYAPSARFSMQHTVTETMTLAYNLGVEWDGESTDPVYLYTLAGGFSLDDALGFYAELYGFAPQSESAEHLADAGFTYLIQQNMMADFSAGIGITTNAPDFFLALGFSIRLWD
ncbi:MAG TPA: transporter [Bacteroidota bacterium]|nr:transporter [Bacteroidota bacterium]